MACNKVKAKGMMSVTLNNITDIGQHQDNKYFFYLWPTKNLQSAELGSVDGTCDRFSFRTELLVGGEDC